MAIGNDAGLGSNGRTPVVTMRILLLGAGYSARAFAAKLAGSVDFIGGTTRSTGKAERLSRIGIAPFLFDGTTLSPELAAALATATHVVVSAAPGSEGDPVLGVTRDTFLGHMPALRWIGYLSTVGVYGNHHGGWVDEATPCRPLSPDSKARLVAEEAWLALGRQAGVPVAILRLSGIYGPGRNALAAVANGTARPIVKAGQVFNRIHVEDIAAALALLARDGRGGVFNLADDEPSPPQDVVAYAAGLMGVPPPPEIPFETAGMSPMARSFYAESKRVSNAAIKRAGLAFAYPDYRKALSAMWERGDWRAEAG